MYNLVGGMSVWNGLKAAGHWEFGLENFTGHEDYPDAVMLAYTMETNLQKFYMLLSSEADNQDEKRLFQQLAEYEDRHKSMLLDECRLNLQDSCVESDYAEAVGVSGEIEGGENIDEALKKFRSAMEGLEEILDTAMMIEAQAMDLYMRMAQKSLKSTTKELFLRLSDQEKGHLNLLAGELDKVLVQ